MKLNVYLAGEIHTSWREEIIADMSVAETRYQVYRPVRDQGHQMIAGCHLGAELTSLA